MKHKHHDMIVEWAKDQSKKVYCNYNGRGWELDRQMGWYQDEEYSFDPFSELGLQKDKHYLIQDEEYPEILFIAIFAGDHFKYHPDGRNDFFLVGDKRYSVIKCLGNLNEELPKSAIKRSLGGAKL